MNIPKRNMDTVNWRMGSVQYLLCVFFLVIGQQLAAQIPLMYLLSADSAYKQSNGFMQISGDGLMGSNALDNSFFKKSIFGGHLENGHLDKLQSVMKDQNRAGFIASVSLEIYNMRDTIFNRPQWGIRAGFSTNYHGAMSFSKDLYSVIYRGNAAFMNDTAMLGPLNYQFQAWQKMGFGIFNKHNLSSLTLSLVEGQKLQSLIVSEAGLYTSMNGDSLALSYRGDLLRSDRARSGLANGSGIGAALDLDYNLPLEEHNGVISISLRDFGFVAWNRMSEKITYDSITSWTGVNVHDVFQMTSDSLDLPGLKDSLNYSTQFKRVLMPLPASVHLRYSRFFSAKNFYEAGISIWPNKAAVPLVYAGLSHFISEHFLLSEKVSFGGYGRFGIGAEVQWMPRGAWLFRVGTRHIGGFTMGSARSVDAYFSLAKIF